MVRLQFSSKWIAVKALQFTMYLLHTILLVCLREIEIEKLIIITADD